MSNDEIYFLPETIERMKASMDIPPDDDEEEEEEVCYTNPTLQKKIDAYLWLTKRYRASDPSQRYIIRILQAFDWDVNKAASTYNQARKKGRRLALEYSFKELEFVKEPIIDHVWDHFETKELAQEFLDGVWERSGLVSAAVLEIDFFDYVDSKLGVHDHKGESARL